MKKYRIAVVGTGKMVSEDHLPAIVSSTRYILCAVCDTNLESAQILAEKYKVSSYDSVADLVKHEQIDVALVAVPHFQYLPIIEILSSHRINILKEKPMATSMKEALNIDKLIRDSGIVILITLQRRFHPIFRAFAQLSKHIGEIYSLEGKYTMNISRLDLGWRASKSKAGGGALIDMGYHYIDLLVWYFGIPNTVSAKLLFTAKQQQKYDVEDTIHLLFDYGSNSKFNHEAVGSFIISRAYPLKNESLLVIGTNGAIDLRRGSIRRLSLEGEEIEKLERFGDWRSAFLDQLDYFADILDGNSPNLIENFRGHYKHVAIIEAAYRSWYEQKAINPLDIISEYSVGDFI